jgi:hypothetical protein
MGVVGVMTVSGVFMMGEEGSSFVDFGVEDRVFTTSEATSGASAEPVQM